ncbi:MAG: DEAD/DEAH box helicase, partial [Crenarchaeota archaeon]|nr:DEAD/DEAH box helicase [Thermoproteota archaeon]
MDTLTAEEYLDSAEFFLSERNYNRAVNLIKNVLAKFPENKRAINLLKKWSINTGNPLIDENSEIKPDIIGNTNYLNDFIHEIFQKSNIWSEIVDYRMFPAKKGVYGDINTSVGPEIDSFLKEGKIHLYSHQAKVFDYIKSGKNVIISTPTASGKTFSFSLPIFDILSQNEEYKAIFLYPTKALINDQLIALEKLVSDTKISLQIGKYDGDTESGLRAWNLKNSRIILTNPDMLHFHLTDNEFLHYLKKVKFFVIDEAHTYRGIFGTHVSQLIKRLQRRCNTFDNDPQFILATATLGNPIEFSKWLIGKDCELLSESGAPIGEKTIFLVNPFKIISKSSLNQTSSNILGECVLHNLQTLCFSLSRIDAEIIREKSLRYLNENSIGDDTPDKSLIISYRGGYTVEERIKLERKLKNREILGCSTTNALEVGIDIGGLDVAIVSGYPGSMISTWQQMGRSGRSQQPSIGFFVANYDVVDQYFVKDSEYFFNLRNEDAIVSTFNKDIQYFHLCCAAYENPINMSEESDSFGDILSLLKEKCHNDELLSRDGKIFFIGQGIPHNRNNLRNTSAEGFVVKYRGKELEKMDRLQAYREGYNQAIILHQESKYCVIDIDLQNRIISVDKVDVPYYTRSIKNI